MDFRVLGFIALLVPLASCVVLGDPDDKGGKKPSDGKAQDRQFGPFGPEGYGGGFGGPYPGSHLGGFPPTGNYFPSGPGGYQGSYNQGGYYQGGYNQGGQYYNQGGQYPPTGFNGGFPTGGYPNGYFPNGGNQNGGYPNNGYNNGGQYPGGYGGNYPPFGGFGNGYRPGYGNPYGPGGFPNLANIDPQQAAALGHAIGNSLRPLLQGAGGLRDQRN